MDELHVWRIQSVVLVSAMRRRVAILYCPSVIACRQCYRLTFRSQREDSHGRDFRRINKLRARLNWPAGVMHRVFSRPKGMHHKTFRRLMVTYRKLELAVLRRIEAQYDARASELDMLKEVYGGGKGDVLLH